MEGLNYTGAGVSKFLSNLPSRGFFSSTVPSSASVKMRVYICDHDTSPPEDQLIKTDPENILIRALMLKNPKGDSSLKEGKSTSASQSMKKRIADKVLEKASGKKALSGAQLPSSQAFVALPSSTPDKDLPSLTVERLRALLKEKGLSTKGKKDELIARLRAANE